MGRNKMADLETTDIQQFLKSCANERKAIRGLNEVARGLEKRTSVCAFLANDVSEDQYKKLIEALARDANIPMVKPPKLSNADALPFESGQLWVAKLPKNSKPP